MKHSGFWMVLAFVLFGFVLVVHAQSPQRTPDSPTESWKVIEGPFNDYCTMCHQRLGTRLADPVKEWRGSIHAWRGVFCDTCHGGDPTSTVLTIAMGEQNGFMEAPLPPAIPEDCGRCHEAALQSWKESVHGDLFEVNDYEPNCVTCHNSHDVREVSLNLVSLDAACGECHNIDYINEVRLPLEAADKKLKDLYARVNAMPAGNPNVPYIRNRLDRVQKEFRGLAHYLSSNIIVQRRQSIDRELGYIEFLIAFDDSVVR